MKEILLKFKENGRKNTQALIIVDIVKKAL